MLKVNLRLCPNHKNELSEKVWRSFSSLRSPGSLPKDVVIALTVNDPRLSFLSVFLFKLIMRLQQLHDPIQFSFLGRKMPARSGSVSMDKDLDRFLVPFLQLMHLNNKIDQKNNILVGLAL